MAEMIFFCFAATFCVLYVVLMIFYIIGWYKLKTPPPSPLLERGQGLPAERNFILQAGGEVFSTKVSVVIPARNEQENIENCLNDIARQNFPKELFEIIVVDDNSTDSTVERVEKFIGGGEVATLIKLKNDNAGGKKAAITKAIEQSRGDLIVTTDADCRMGSNWLSTIVSYYEHKKPEMIVAPVCLHNPKYPETFFEKLQTLEFIGLIAATGAAIEHKCPIMCNGANLAYQKNAFKTVKGFNDFNSLASGDDMHLMLKIKNTFPGGVKFIKSLDAVIYTKPKTSLPEFIRQRRRWTSKTLTYNDFTVAAVATIVYIFNISILASLVLLFFLPDVRSLFILIFGAKCIIDFLFLFLTTSFFKRRGLMWLYIPGQIFNVFYVSFIGITGVIGKYRWKDRVVK